MYVACEQMSSKMWSELSPLPLQYSSTVPKTDSRLVTASAQAFKHLSPNLACPVYSDVEITDLQNTP